MSTTTKDDDQDVLFDGDEKVAKPEEKQKDQAGSESVVEGRYRISPLTLTVFKRETEDGNVFRNYQLQRAYPKDDDGEEFGYTESLRPRDLRKAARLFELAADEIQGLKKENSGGDA